MPVTIDQIQLAQTILQNLHFDKFENMLRTFFQQNPLNNDFYVVATKVTLVEKIYSTPLRFIGGPYTVAEKISSIVDIDNVIGEDMNGVVTIVNALHCNNRRPFSFSSKYCHFHKPDIYPIYDDKAHSALKRINHNIWLNIPNKEFDVLKNGTYQGYKTAITNLKEKVGMHLTFAEIDHYLWTAGQAMNPKNGNKLLQKYFENHSAIRDQLIPVD